MVHFFFFDFCRIIELSLHWNENRGIDINELKNIIQETNLLSQTFSIHEKFVHEKETYVNMKLKHEH